MRGGWYVNVEFCFDDDNDDKLWNATYAIEFDDKEIRSCIKRDNKTG